MITKLTLDNFKGHRHTELDLGRFTVLVGPNGSGKTSVLEALHLMRRAAAPGSAVPGPEQLNVPVRDLTSLRRINDAGPLRVSAGNEEATWTCTIDGSGVNFTSPPPSHTLGIRYTFFRFDAERIGAATAASHAPIVDYDGSGTASALAALKLADDEAYDAIERALSAIVPAVKRIRIKLADGAYQILLDHAGAEAVPAPLASAGTLVTLALLTSVSTGTPSANRLVLIDDLDHSLHPTAQTELMRQLHALVERGPDLQIVATTHSPYILDGIEPENVQVFFPREDGEIISKKLSEHPDAQRAKGTLSTGEIWTLDPESWVTGAPTHP
jgi:predicted ATPase